MNKEIVNVLDHGYVRHVEHMGDDLSIVNAARVSFEKESDSFNSKDARLIAFLARRDENSPLRHAVISLECYAPLMVARQWYKYAVASAHVEDQNGWNESSRRYVTEQPTFYVPTEWREAPEDKKQGSGSNLLSLPVEKWNEWESSDFDFDVFDDGLYLPEDYSNFWTAELQAYITQGLHLYNKALDHNVAPEQARLFLPAYGMYIRWRWTASLGSALHFLNQRLADDAQKEIQVYAQATRELLEPIFPATVKEFVDG